jgi:hypothetical protein
MDVAQITFDQIRGFLEASQVSCNAREDHFVCETGFRMPTGEFRVFIQVDGEPPLVSVHVPIQMIVPEGRRPQAAETAARANCDLRTGGFNLDMSTGRLWFRIAMPAADTGITQAQFDWLMHAAAWTVNRYYSAFGRLLFGDDLSPAEVIAEVEMAK